MAIALVTHAAAQAPSISADAVTADVDTTGATLLVAICVLNDSIYAPTDNKGNTWVAIDTQAQTIFSGVYYVQSPTVGTGHHFTLSGASRVAGIAVMAFSGTNTLAAVDQHTKAANSLGTSPITAGSITPSENNEVVATFLAGNMLETIAVDSSCTLVDHLPFLAGQAYCVASAYIVQTTAGAINPSWSYGSPSVEHAYNDSFKASTAKTFILIPGR